MCTLKLGTCVRIIDFFEDFLVVVGLCLAEVNSSIPSVTSKKPA